MELISIFCAKRLVYHWSRARVSSSADLPRLHHTLLFKCDASSKNMSLQASTTVQLKVQESDKLILCSSALESWWSDSPCWGFVGGADSGRRRDRDLLPRAGSWSGSPGSGRSGRCPCEEPWTRGTPSGFGRSKPTEMRFLTSIGFLQRLDRFEFEVLQWASFLSRRQRPNES